MEPGPSQFRVLKFGVFEVDLEARELRKSGMRQKLVGQPFQVLQLLLERSQEIVTREELQQRIWPQDTIVDYDLALKKAVNRLRELLGDSAESPRFIETIPRRGYRFIATVEGVSGGAGADGARREEMPTRSQWLGWTAAIACFAALAATLLALNAFSVRDRVLGAPVPRIQSLAILPLTNLAGDPAQEYFSDGMTDALITELSQIGSVKVISRTSIMGYKKTNKRLPEIARELKVDGIIEGTVQRSGDRVRITAQLIYGPSDKHLWAASYERDMHDVFTLERDVTQEIARQIRAQVTAQKQMPTTQPRALNLKAWDAYLQGNFHLNRYGSGFGDEEKRRAAEYFQQAIDADPNYAPAYVGMALAHDALNRASREDNAIVRRSAERAVALDPTSSDAWVILAEAKRWDDWDWHGAEETYRRAIAVNPNSALAHQDLGNLLGDLGRSDDGLRECMIAQQLDPNQDHLSEILYARREYSRAIELLQRVAEARPNDGMARYSLSGFYALAGRYAESIQQLEQTIRLFGFPESPVRLHRAFAASGYRGAMREWARELEHLDETNQGFFPVNLAEVYAVLGENDRAFYWLEQAYQRRDIMSQGAHLSSLKVDPFLDPLRSDPRFKDLLRRVGLPP